jgi:hypothetical protein
MTKLIWHIAYKSKGDVQMLSPPRLQDVKENVAPLIRATEKSSSLPSKFWMRDYLRTAYRLYRRWKWQKIASKESRRLAHRCRIRITHRAHPIRVLIAATCSTSDLKIQSRWTRALEYASFKKVRPKGLSKFIRENGGLSGCAQAMARLKPKRKPVREWL